MDDKSGTDAATATGTVGGVVEVVRPVLLSRDDIAAVDASSPPAENVIIPPSPPVGKIKF